MPHIWGWEGQLRSSDFAARKKVLSWARTGGSCQARGGDVVRVEATGLAAAMRVNQSAEDRPARR